MGGRERSRGSGAEDGKRFGAGNLRVGVVGVRCVLDWGRYECNHQLAIPLHSAFHIAFGSVSDQSAND